MAGDTEIYQFVHVNSNTAGAAIVTPVSGQSTGSILSGVVVNTKGVTGNLLTLYNGTSTSAPVIAAVDTTALPGNFSFNCPCNGGLFYSLANGTAADLTILFK